MSGINTPWIPVGASSADLSESTHLQPDVSITAHSGFINGLLRVVGRGTYSLPTGGMSIPRSRRKFFRVSPSHLGVIPIVIKRTVS